MALARAAHEGIGREVTVVFGHAVTAVKGTIVEAHEDCLVLRGTTIGVTTGGPQIHVIPYTGVAFIRIPDPVDP